LKISKGTNFENPQVKTNNVFQECYNQQVATYKTIGILLALSPWIVDLLTYPQQVIQHKCLFDEFFKGKRTLSSLLI
jgi:hypothetical protein